MVIRFLYEMERRNGTGVGSENIPARCSLCNLGKMCNHSVQVKKGPQLFPAGSARKHPETAELSVRSVASITPTKCHSARARLLSERRESGIMTGGRVAMEGRLSRFSEKRLKPQRRLC